MFLVALLIVFVGCLVLAAYLYGRLAEAKMWIETAGRTYNPVWYDETAYYVLTQAQWDAMDDRLVTKMSPESVVELQTVTETVYVAVDPMLSHPYPVTLETPPQSLSSDAS